MKFIIIYHTIDVNINIISRNRDSLFCLICRYPKIIVLDDVRGALLNREEFDIFTNQGLGSKYRLTTMD